MTLSDCAEPIQTASRDDGGSGALFRVAPSAQTAPEGIDGGNEIFATAVVLDHLGRHRPALLVGCLDGHSGPGIRLGHAPLREAGNTQLRFRLDDDYYLESCRHVRL